MAGERYRHIFLRGPTRSQGFTNPRRGGSSPRIPDRNRTEHSEYLRQRFAEAWAESDTRQAVVHTDRHGAYIEFTGAPDSLRPSARESVFKTSAGKVRAKRNEHWPRFMFRTPNGDISSERLMLTRPK
jgi:hypothetical protein